MKKICARCSADFTCREDRTDLCQCTRTYMVPGSRDFVKDNYSSCLCHQCLKETSSSFYMVGVNPKFATKSNNDK